MKKITDNVILYIEGKKSEGYTQQLIDNYAEIHDRYFNQYNKLFLPINRLDDIKATIIKKLEHNLRYTYPYLDEKDIQNEITLFEELYTKTSENISKSVSFLNGSDYPYLLDVSEQDKIDYYNEDHFLDFMDWVYGYIIQKNTIYEDLAEFPDQKEYDPDEDDKYKSIAYDIQSKIEALGNAGAYKLLTHILMTTAKECGLEHLEIEHITKSSKLLQSRTNIIQEQHLSRLLIDINYRILLQDYSHQEIKIPTLSKVVFIFFLRHPEGILFKEIHNYKKEIHSIYYKITNRSDTDILDKSLADLLDPTSNSLNEKCSRIKEAFVSVIGDNLAQYYYVTGERRRPKSIKLPRDLVTFEK